MREIVISVISVILAVTIIFLLNSESDRAKKQQSKNNEIEIQASALIKEKRGYEYELEQLKSNVIQKEKGISNLMLIFTEINELFSIEVIPKLSEINVPATICLSTESISVMNDAVSGFDLQKLLESGWQTALYWDGTIGFDQWISDIKSVLAENNVEIPKLLCVNFHSYTPSFTDTVIQAGFTDLAVNFGDSDAAIENINNSLNIINANSWYTTASSTALSSLNFVDSQLAFFVGINGKELAYESVQFAAMLTTALSKQNTGKLILTTPENSRKQIIKNEEEYIKAVEEYRIKVAELEKNIAEVDSLIDKIYAESPN